MAYYEYISYQTYHNFIKNSYQNYLKKNDNNTFKLRQSRIFHLLLILNLDNFVKKNEIKKDLKLILEQKYFFLKWYNQKLLVFIS